MIAKPLDAVTAADLKLLVETGVREQRTIQYKRELPGSSDSEKKNPRLTCPRSQMLQGET